ncbi:hypothetical protein Nepgr_000109 [Nepenthes gracilis]|uniref:Uncharacterized protein n=1 Tax=Nepenthes gracilis TaxID=150966 RepID=A0AAD3P3Z8_NEPGR|nr:hypothetical protein Nepgr_000109 [Nepenthes gracilis]
MACDAPEFLQDKKKRRASQKESTARGSSISSEASLMRSCSRKSTSSKSPALVRSSSLKTSTSSISRNSSPPLLRRSSSSTTKNSPPLSGSLSQKSSAFTRKCSTLAKEHKARFYIMKRCVAMLLCWRKDNDS